MSEGIKIPKYWKELVTHHIEKWIITSFMPKSNTYQQIEQQKYAKIDHNFKTRKFITRNRIIYEYQQKQILPDKDNKNQANFSCVNFWKRCVSPSDHHHIYLCIIQH